MKNINWIDHLLNFVSVILGVSMAFYVSNWSEDRKNRNESIRIVESLIQELELNIRVYEKFQLAYNWEQADHLNKAILDIRNNQLDSLPFLTRGGIGYNNYAPQSVTFNSITSSGKFGLIEDYELQIRISAFYEISAKEAKFRGDTQVEFYKEQFLPMIIESTDLMDPKVEDIQLKQLTNMLLLYQNMIKSKIANYKEVVTSGKTLIESLNTYKENL